MKPSLHETNIFNADISIFLTLYNIQHMSVLKRVQSVSQFN